MDLHGKTANFIIQSAGQTDRIDFQPKFLVAMDSSDGGEQMQHNEIVFLDGSIGEEDEENTADKHERDCFIEGEEVDLSLADGMDQMDLSTDIDDDTNEPYHDGEGALYYICDKCTFVCIDFATLKQHSNQSHPEKRPRNNNSALGFSEIAEHLNHNEIDPSHEEAASATITSLSLPSPASTSASSSSSSSSSSFDDLKPFECEICHKRLSTRANLRGHMTIHSNDKPFVCGLCTKRFKQKRHLKYHQKIHYARTIETDQIICAYDEDDSPLSLESDESIQELQLKLRESLGCGNMSWYQCTQCPMLFAQKRDLYRHQRIHTPNYQCKLCQKMFKSEKNLREHMQTHVCYGIPLYE